MKRKNSHEVRTASTGQSALTIAREFKPDVVLLDIRLPDLDGYDVLRRLKEMDGLGKAKFIAVTGYDEDEVEKHSGEARFDFVLPKPVDAAYLESVISAKT